MDFSDTPAEAAFRAEARRWIAANAPSQHRVALERSSFGVLRVGGDEAEKLAICRDWQRRKFEGGWACLHWPSEYGGRDAGPVERLIWEQEEGVYGKLGERFVIGQGMIGPTLMAHGSPAHKRRHLVPMASGEEIWCQLFSEPAAGSDLAGIRTRCERTAGGWRVNGQKVWTSGAHYSDWGLMLARTDPSVPKHRGLSMFIVNMRSPGVEIRPIRQMSGQSGFNQVFFTDVFIPDEDMLGASGDGWSIALTTLMNERQAVSSSMTTGFDDIFDFCLRFDWRGGKAIDDPVVRSKLATWAARTSGLRFTAMRTISSAARGEVPGPENSILKLVAGMTMQEIAKFALDLQGAAGMVASPEFAEEEGKFQLMLLRSPGMRVEGGTDEIQRNILAERVLGMPPDHRVDKDVSFAALMQAAGDAARRS
ncbi:acyl-CoA dehydrogenase family protein [Alsobacter sp. SYSU M60028]|uniref:Acyl-CoA dehydrogenase family protein n=1 Tax=Alsobacter ponti TaxID=2962936 RepID=A0ABT1LEQ9_9HYPH|nr:acyl-CoA dehydrogenase family protein [Alsobacter ponti]MCP8939982.1 acyl-CoA dehydrogenase family protein [Alsobacter ponti]